jgi:ADP-heptose:LPS heptosyltransferase
MNLLIFKLNHLGDNVVFLPVVQALRVQCPDWKITVITTPREAELYGGLLAPAEVLTCGKLRFDKAWRRPWELAAWFARVRARQPEACLISFDQASVPHLLARHSGASLRVGGNLEHIRFAGTLTHEVPLPAGARPADWNWEMARTLVQVAGRGPLAATPPPPDLWHLISPSPRPDRRHVVVHAGSSGPVTRWPVERFAAVANQLAEDHEVTWVERPEISGVSLADPVRRVAPDSIRALVSLLARADFFLGNNSGPMHLANGLGLAGVVVTGSSAPGWDPYWFRERWSVLRHPSLPCQPCERPNKATVACANTANPLACLQYWSAQAVEAACRETLARVASERQA